MKILSVTLACLFALTVVAPAQEASPDAGSPRPRVVVRPGQNSPAPGTTPDAGMRVEDLLAVYGKLIGKHVIYDNKVLGTIPLSLAADLPDAKKAELIEKALFLSGYALIDNGEDVVEVLGLGSQPRSEGLPIYTKPEELPHNERVFSYVVKLEHHDALEMVGVLQQYVPPSNLTAFNADPKSHMIIVTGTTTIMRAVLKLIPLLDSPSPAP